MAEKMTEIPPPQLDIDAKWDACCDLTLRRFVYSTMAGAVSSLLFFRTPTTRWAAVAFGAGIGLGSAYRECSYIFEGSMPKWPSSPSPSLPPPSKE